MNPKDQNITEEEAELYDRQIRLWGANVQRSLRNTRVLVIGMKGVAGEVCKNLILSGVKSVTMMDDEKVSKSDRNSQYLLYPESAGKNRAEGSLQAGKLLNPNVKVSYDACNVLDKPASYYSNFDVVCATNQPFSVYVFLNDVCKLHRTKFYCGDSFGMFGYLFEDLNREKRVGKIWNLTSFQTALTLKWAPKTSVKKRNLEDPSFLIFQVLVEFHARNGRSPSRKSPKDYEQLCSLRMDVLKKFNVEQDMLPMEYLENVYGEYGPTCSIIGGMMAQQIVKSLSKDEFASTGIYFFNHVRCQMSGIPLDETITPSKGNENEVVEL